MPDESVIRDDAPQEAEPARVRYDAAGWLERAQQFRTPDGRRVSRHVMAAALHGTESGKTFTQSQVEKLLGQVHSQSRDYLEASP